MNHYKPISFIVFNVVPILTFSRSPTFSMTFENIKKIFVTQPRILFPYSLLLYIICKYIIVIVLYKEHREIHFK